MNSSRNLPDSVCGFVPSLQRLTYLTVKLPTPITVPCCLCSAVQYLMSLENSFSKRCLLLSFQYRSPMKTSRMKMRSREPTMVPTIIPALFGAVKSAWITRNYSLRSSVTERNKVWRIHYTVLFLLSGAVGTAVFGLWPFKVKKMSTLHVTHFMK